MTLLEVLKIYSFCAPKTVYLYFFWYTFTFVGQRRSLTTQLMLQQAEINIGLEGHSKDFNSHARRNMPEFTCGKLEHLFKHGLYYSITWMVKLLSETSAAEDQKAM